MFVNYTLAFVRKLCQESVLFMYIFTWRGSLSSLPGPHKRLGKPFLGHQRHPYRFLLLHLYPWSIPGLPQSQCLPRNCQQRFGQSHIFTTICNFMRWLIVQNRFFLQRKISVATVHTCFQGFLESVVGRVAICLLQIQPMMVRRSQKNHHFGLKRSFSSLFPFKQTMKTFLLVLKQNYFD